MQHYVGCVDMIQPNNENWLNRLEHYRVSKWDTWAGQEQIQEASTLAKVFSSVVLPIKYDIKY